MKYLIFAIFIPILYSCNKLDGKIEARGNSKVYLVNASTTNTFKFTVKTTSITNDSIYNYQTQIIELAPGDEILLGNKNEVTAIEYPTITTYIFKKVSAKEKIKSEMSGQEMFYSMPADKAIFHYNNEGYLIPERQLNDTIINGINVKYYYQSISNKDTLHPYPRKYYKYEYEVTGQVEVKFKAADVQKKE